MSVEPSSGLCAAKANVKADHGNVRRVALVLALSLALLGGTAAAGSITAVGAVSALTDIDQLGYVTGTAGFDMTPVWSEFPGGAYTAAGMTMNEGSLGTILPGCVSGGTAYLPRSYYFDAFINPIAGGGSADGLSSACYGLVATFSAPITQWGATFSKNGTQYLTAWASDGALIGQVTWNPSFDSAFVGIDTGSVPIAMLALGNDDVYGGAEYDVGGHTPIWDNAMWGNSVPEPSTFALFGLAVGALVWHRRRRRP